MFQDQMIKDPHTGKERIITAEEQELLLEKGILLDIPLEASSSQEK